MRVAIVGSREWADSGVVYGAVERAEAEADEAGESLTIVSGGARGVDSFAEEYARELGISVLVLRADWDRHGKAAGFIRNEEIVEAADWVIAFWDGQSKGTKHTIDLCLKHRKNLEVIFP